MTRDPIRNDLGEFLRARRGELSPSEVGLSAGGQVRRVAGLITDFGTIPADERYYSRLLVTAPTMRELYADWEGVTRLAIAQMRMHNSAHPGDAQLAALTDELSARYPQFQRWWADHHVA